MLQYLKTDMLRGLMVSLMAVMTLSLYAQQTDPANESKADDNPFGPTFMPMVKVGKVLEGGDSIQYMEMNNVYVYPPISFSSKKQQMAFNRLVRNVKRVLPIAKEARTIMMETAEFLETLPDKKSKEEHMKRVEKSIWKEYQPKMKKLTYSQGKLLIKLIYRESHSSSYNMIQAFLGPVRAGFYQAFAWAFGASLKKEYDPEGVDRLTERDTCPFVSYAKSQSVIDFIERRFLEFDRAYACQNRFHYVNHLLVMRAIYEGMITPIVVFSVSFSFLEFPVWHSFWLPCQSLLSSFCAELVAAYLFEGSVLFVWCILVYGIMVWVVKLLACEARKTANTQIKEIVVAYHEFFV